MHTSTSWAEQIVADHYGSYHCDMHRFLAIRGLSQSIDFTGGRNFKVQFENKVEPEQVRELISSKFGDANVSVIAIGTDGKTVRISTNYRIEEEGNNIDSEIEAYLYETLKPLLTQNITLETFIDRENHTGGSIISSQKVRSKYCRRHQGIGHLVCCAGFDCHRLVHPTPFP